MSVITGENNSAAFILPFPKGGQSAHTTAPLEVVIFQCSAEQMMQTRGLNTAQHVRRCFVI